MSDGVEGIGHPRERAQYLGAFSEDQVTCLDFPFGGFKATSESLTIRYRDSSVDSNIPGTSLDQGGCSLVYDVERSMWTLEKAPAAWRRPLRLRWLYLDLC